MLNTEYNHQYKAQVNSLLVNAVSVSNSNPNNYLSMSSRHSQASHLDQVIVHSFRRSPVKHDRGIFCPRHAPRHKRSTPCHKKAEDSVEIFSSIQMFSTYFLTAAALASSVLGASQPFTPAGGLGTNSTPPKYIALSDFDYQSLASLYYFLSIDNYDLDLINQSESRFKSRMD